jgi:iron complex outermembrane recepter protein
MSKNGTISGKVTDSQTGRALPGAQISISGTLHTAVSDAQGAYHLTSFPGSLTLKCATLGYAAQQKTVTLTAGGASTVNFALATQSIDLSGL